MSDQITFTDALLDPTRDVPKGLINPDKTPATKRFDVYRNNVVISLIDAMIVAFPVVHKLVGDEFFKAMAAVYVRQHPPKDPLLMFYGAQFSTFLEKFPPVQSLPYLPDVARLELARRYAYHAADDQAVGAECIVQTLTDDPTDVRFTFAPAMHLLSSEYPIWGLWMANMTPDAPKPEMKPEVVLIYRPEFDLDMALLSNDSFTFLSALHAGQTLGESLDLVGDDFDLAGMIKLMLDAKIITKLTKKGT